LAAGVTMPPATSIIASVATLAVAGLVAIGLTVASGDVELGAITISGILLLVVLVVPVTLLLAWGEVDLSFIGIFTLGGYLYLELSDSGVAAALVVAALAATLTGLLVGVLRYGLRIPSGLISAGAGAAIAAFVFSLAGVQGATVAPDSIVEGAALPVLGALGVTAVATVLALVASSRGADPNRAVGDLPGPEVVIGYGLSGFAAGVAGAITTAQIVFFQPQQGSGLLLQVLAAVAIAGVARGSGVIAPLAGAAAGVIVGVIRLAIGDFTDLGVALGALLLFSLVLGHGIHRLAGLSGRPAR
jgi:ribose/xylose/arabinose/galactoside ABC-type transport system permease subunit